MNVHRSPLKVLHVIDSLAPGGAEHMLVELVNAYDRRSILPFVCVTRQDLSLDKQIKTDVPVYCLDRRSTWDRQGFKRLAQIVQQHTCQVFHVHGYSSFRFILAARTMHRLPLPILVHAHSSQQPDKLTQLVGRWGISHLVAVSPTTATWAHSHLNLPVEHISVVGNAIDPIPYQQAAQVDLEAYFTSLPRKVGIVVANLLPVKNYEMLFKALAASKHRQEIGLLVAGDTGNSAYFASCHNLLEELKLEDRVVFLGRRTDIPGLLQSVDFGLFTSWRETGPLALLEYMAAGLPFVSTRVGQIGDTLVGYGMAAFVPPGDESGFTRALDELLDAPPEEWERRQQQGRRLIAEEFDLQVRISQLQAIYESLVAGKRLCA